MKYFQKYVYYACFFIKLGRNNIGFVYFLAVYYHLHLSQLLPAFHGRFHVVTKLRFVFCKLCRSFFYNSRRYSLCRRFNVFFFSFYNFNSVKPRNFGREQLVCTKPVVEKRFCVLVALGGCFSRHYNRNKLHAVF